MSEKRCTRYEQLSLLYQAFWLAMCWVVPSLLYVLLAQCQGACGACDWSFESGLALEQVGQDYWRLLGARMTGSCHLFGKDWQVEEWNNNQLHDR